MVNPKRPDEILENLSPNNHGLIDLPETHVADGVKYQLQNTEGRQYSNTLHVKPENLEKYIYVPAQEGAAKEEKAGKEKEAPVEETPSADTLANEILEDYATGEAQEEISDEKKAEAIRLNLDATVALRSYFRNFLGVNPEDFAKRAPELRNRPDGKIIIAGATQHFIGAKIGAIMARRGIKIADTYDLVSRLNRMDDYTAKPEYYSDVFHAYKEMGYADNTAKRLTNSFFEFISDANVMGIFYAMRTWESDFGLAAATVYNRKLAAAGPLAELYTAESIKQLQEELSGTKVSAEDIEGAASEKIQELQKLAATEIEDTEAVGLEESYTGTIKELSDEFASAANSAHISPIDEEIAIANVLRITPDKTAIFSTAELNNSIVYAMHKAYKAGYTVQDLENIVKRSDTIVDDLDVDSLKAIKTHVLELMSDADGPMLPGKFMGETIDEIFSSDGLFSTDKANVERAQRHLIRLGLMVYAKENNLEINADWNDEQYKDALDFIKNNFSVGSAVSEYVQYQSEYTPANILAAAAANKAAIQYAYGVKKARVALAHLDGIPPQHQAISANPGLTDTELEEGEPMPVEGENAEEEPENDIDSKEEQAAMKNIAPPDIVENLANGKPVVLKGDDGEPEFKLEMGEDDLVFTVTTLPDGKTFTIPTDSDDADNLSLLLLDVDAAPSASEKLSKKTELLNFLNELSLKYSNPEAREAAKMFAEGATKQEEESPQQEFEEEQPSGKTPARVEKQEEPQAEQEQQQEKEDESAGQKPTKIIEETASTQQEEELPAEGAQTELEATAKEINDVEKEALAADGLPEDIADTVKEKVEGESTEEPGEQVGEEQPAEEEEKVQENTPTVGGEIRLESPTGKQEKFNLEKLAGKPVTDLTKNDVYELLGNEEAMRELGTSQKAKDIADKASRIGVPEEYVRGLVGSSLFRELLYENPNLIKELSKFPKNRKNVIIPTVTVDAKGNPAVYLEKFSLKNGRRATTKVTGFEPPLSEEDKKTIEKYLNTLKRYVPALEKVGDVLNSDKTARQALYDAYSGGKAEYLQRVATDARKKLKDYFGESAEYVKEEAVRGRYPLTRELIDKYALDLYPPTQIREGEFAATNPYTGERVTGKTYGEALDNLISSLDDAAKEGKIPQDFVDVFRNTVSKDIELREKYSGKVPEELQKEVDDGIGRSSTFLYQKVRDAINDMSLVKLGTDPETYAKNQFARTLRAITNELATRFNITDLHSVVQHLEDKGTNITQNDIQQALDVIGKYAPDSEKTLQHTYSQIMEMAKEYKPRWEKDIEDFKQKQELDTKFREIAAKADDAYQKLWDKVMPNRKLTAKTAYKKIHDTFKEVDDALTTLEQLRPGTTDRVRNQIYNFIKDVYSRYELPVPSGLPKPDNITSLEELAPYMLDAYNIVRQKKNGLPPYKGIEDFSPPKTTPKPASTEEPTGEKETENKTAKTSKAGGKKKETKKPATKQEVATASKLPSKSNIDATLNTIKAKYMKGKKPPTEGRVKRAITTQFSKLFGENPGEDVLKELNEHFGTNAKDYDELLTTLAQEIVNAYDKKHSEELKEAAKKVKETKPTDEEKLASGFDANEIRRGLSNFIENYPIPPKAVEDLVSKYGSDFSKWSPEALEELGQKLRKAFGNNSIGQSIQEFFPKGFVVEQPEPEKEESAEENGAPEETEGPTEEDLEALEENEEF